MMEAYDRPIGPWVITDPATNLYTRRHRHDLVEYITYRHCDDDAIVAYHGGIDTRYMQLTVEIDRQIRAADSHRTNYGGHGFRMLNRPPESPAAVQFTCYFSHDNIAYGGEVPYYEDPDTDWAVFPNLESVRSAITRITGLKAG